MSRTPPPAPELPERPKSDLIIEERTYRFLTPVFGGGVIPQQHDPITPIRVPAIRGQLRFWWRAVNPRGLTKVEDLREAEAEVFGSTEARSPLSVSVPQQPAPPKRLEVLEGRFGAHKGYESIAYGAFPLRGEKDTPHGVLWSYGDAEFPVRLHFPESLRADIEAALWGWETFGGLGARTRRGFGAIERTNATDTKLSVPPSPEAGLEKWTGGGDVPWPHLVRAQLGSKSFDGGEKALSALLKELKDMRQGAELGRRPGEGKRLGRSYWPEPDALRRLTGRSTSKHRQPTTHADAFPRAVFGLPIVFHFKDRADPSSNLDARVDGKKADRWASPLILRPYRESNGAVRALAAELAPRPREALVGKHPVRVPLEPAEAHSMPKPKRAPDNSMFLDPIDAFFQRLP